MAKIKGYELVLKVGGTRIAYQQECSLSAQKEMIEKASATQGTAREYLVGLTEWSVDAQGVMASENVNLMRLLLAGSLLEVSMVIGTAETLSGHGYLTNCSYNGGVQGKGKWSVTITGSGALS